MRDSKRDTDVQNSLLDSVGEGEGGTICGNGPETCIISYKKLIASPGLIKDAWGQCTGMTRRDGTGMDFGKFTGLYVTDICWSVLNA